MEEEEAHLLPMTSFSQSFRAGKSLTCTLSSISASLNGEEQDLASVLGTLVTEKPEMWQRLLDCLVACMFLSCMFHRHSKHPTNLP